MRNILPRMEPNENEQSQVDDNEHDDDLTEPTNSLLTEKSDDSATATKEPQPGSAEWYETRKFNHKNVERRRRETIKLAMDELVAVIPGNEKNKSKILKRAVQHIKQLGGQVIALRIQNEEYRNTNQQQQLEIAELRRRLDTQQQQQHEQQQ